MFGSVDEYLSWVDRQDASLQEHELRQELEDEMKRLGYTPSPDEDWLFVDENGNPIDEETAFRIYDKVIEEEFFIKDFKGIAPDYDRVEIYKKMYLASANEEK